MIDLIIKDYKFTKKYFIIAILYCIAVPPMLIIDGGEKLYFANFFIPFITASIMLGKICSVEDSRDMRSVIRLLPYKPWIKILARFLFMMSLLLVTLLYLTIIQYFVFDLSNLNVLIINNIYLFLGFTCYFSFYLMLYYIFGYFIAQYSIYFFIGIAMIAALIYEKAHLNIDFNGLFSGKYSFLLVILGSGIIFLTFFISNMGEKRRNLI